MLNIERISLSALLVSGFILPLLVSCQESQQSKNVRATYWPQKYHSLREALEAHKRALEAVKNERQNMLVIPEQDDDMVRLGADLNVMGEHQGSTTLEESYENEDAYGSENSEELHEEIEAAEDDIREEPNDNITHEYEGEVDASQVEVEDKDEQVGEDSYEEKEKKSNEQEEGLRNHSDEGEQLEEEPDEIYQLEDAAEEEEADKDESAEDSETRSLDQVVEENAEEFDQEIDEVEEDPAGLEARTLDIADARDSNPDALLEELPKLQSTLTRIEESVGKIAEIASRLLPYPQEGTSLITMGNYPKLKPPMPVYPGLIPPPRVQMILLNSEA